MKPITSFLCGLLCLGAIPSFGGDTTPDATHEMLSRIPAAELPDAVAKMIKQTKAREREAATIKDIKSALDINPAAAPAIVGAVSRVSPEMAATAAGVAAAQQPKQASAIARAAAAAAPAKVGKIVEAVCRAVPNDYRDIAVAVSQVVPAAEKSILNAVAAAIPNMKPYIEQAILSYAGNPPSVAAALDQAKSVAAAASIPDQSKPSMAARGPALGPPYIPLSGTPGNVAPPTSGEVPPGGRGYAAP
jgi:hypothetical protein